MNNIIERTSNIQYIYDGEEINFNVMMKLLCESLNSILKNSEEI